MRSLVVAEWFDVSIHPWNESKFKSIILTQADMRFTATGSSCLCTRPERRGQFVAGVRFRAWQPPRCLHPTIEVHCPLRFELVDRSSNRSEGGCTYHVVHPGGRGTDRFPINANEAESRRSARFETIGMTGNQCDGRRFPARNGEPFPITLDLRRG